MRWIGRQQCNIFLILVYEFPESKKLPISLAVILFSPIFFRMFKLFKCLGETKLSCPNKCGADRELIINNLFDRTDYLGKVLLFVFFFTSSQLPVWVGDSLTCTDSELLFVQSAFILSRRAGFNLSSQTILGILEKFCWFVGTKCLKIFTFLFEAYGIICVGNFAVPEYPDYYDVSIRFSYRVIGQFVNYILLQVSRAENMRWFRLGPNIQVRGDSGNALLITFTIAFSSYWTRKRKKIEKWKGPKK